jgi:hypothetical protein
LPSGSFTDQKVVIIFGAVVRSVTPSCSGAAATHIWIWTALGARDRDRRGIASSPLYRGSALHVYKAGPLQAVQTSYIEMCAGWISRRQVIISSLMLTDFCDTWIIGRFFAVHASY